MRYSMPVKTWEVTEAYRVGSNIETRSVAKKDVIVQIENSNQSTEIHEFDTAKECAEFLGLSVEEVWIMGDEHLVLKRNNQKIRVSCDEMTEIRIKRKQSRFDKVYGKSGRAKRKMKENIVYEDGTRQNIKHIWLDLEEPLHGYEQINEEGVLRRRTISGYRCHKYQSIKDGRCLFAFRINNKLIEYDADEIMKKYEGEFERVRKEQENAKQKAKA